jgi:subtilisin family serine protease
MYYFRRLISVSVLGLLFALAFNSMAQKGTSQVIVQFKPNQDDAKIKEVIGKHRAKIRKHVHTVPMKAKGDPGLIVIETSEPAEQAAEKLKQEPAVEFAEPDWIQRHQTEADVDPSAVANDPYYTAGYLWGLLDSGTNSFGTRVSTAWAAGHTGTNSVYIGVIDEGVQWQHADLAANVWNNPFDPIDGVDNDGNGYVDDAHGWDFYSWDNSVYDAGGDYHGTHVSGTIAAAGGNGAGVVGVNWKATIISGKFLGTEGGYTSDAIAAIDYFVDLKERHGLNIVALNNSWGGGGYSQALHDAVLRAAKAGILFVAAAGNGDAYGRGLNNDVLASYPSNYDTTRGTSTESKASYNAVIAVAAIDRNGALATFSNYGSRTVHIGAPGVQILSTVPGGYNYMDGTSMATPHVTGAAALYASTHPGATANTIRQALLQSAVSTMSLTAKTSTGSRLTLSQIIGPASTSSGTLAAHLQSPRVTNQQFQVKLEGVVGQRYEVQVSPDLANWITFGTVTNTTGTMDIADALSVSWPKKFYRAIAR